MSFVWPTVFNRLGCLVVICLCLLFAILNAETAVRSVMCSDEVGATTNSPDGHYRTKVRFEDCGMLYPSLTYVDVEDRSKRNLIRLWTHRETTVFSASGLIDYRNIGVEWPSEHHLMITYPSWSIPAIRRQVTEWGDLKVTHETRVESGRVSDSRLLRNCCRIIDLKSTGVTLILHYGSWRGVLAHVPP